MIRKYVNVCCGGKGSAVKVLYFPPYYTSILGMICEILKNFLMKNKQFSLFILGKYNYSGVIAEVLLFIPFHKLTLSLQFVHEYDQFSDTFACNFIVLIKSTVYISQIYWFINLSRDFEFSTVQVCKSLIHSNIR